ncbi:MAG: hypothetical protein MJ025_01300 [Victivallaceae bacterium]|nr:hypothetical protein [Victivallaceae bacterium]
MLGRVAYAVFWLWKAAVTVLGTVFGSAYLKLWGVRCPLVKCVGLPRVEKSPGGDISIGHGVTLRSARCSNVAGVFRPVSLCTRRNGCISIGDHSGLSAAVVVSESRVSIGKHVLVGPGVGIVDTDFHPLDAVARREPHAAGVSEPVEIGDDVFIGMNSIVLRGVTIGRGSVIAAGSVVADSIPPGVLAAGVPACVVRRLDGDGKI